MTDRGIKIVAGLFAFTICGAIPQGALFFAFSQEKPAWLPAIITFFVVIDVILVVATWQSLERGVMKYILCPKMRMSHAPEGSEEKVNEYDHAKGCPNEGMTAAQVSGSRSRRKRQGND